MAELTVTPPTAADGTFSAAGAAAWNAGMSAASGQLTAARGGTNADLSSGTGMVQSTSGTMSLTALTSTRVPFADSNGKLVDITGFTFAAGVLSVPTAASGPVGSAAACTFQTGAAGTGIYGQSGGLGFATGGALRAFVNSGNGGAIIAYQFSLDPGNTDVTMIRHTANAIQFGPSSNTAAGAATTRTEINKAVTATDAALTTFLTFTIPNLTHAAFGKLFIKSSIGAGGTVGLDEASRSQEFNFVITRVTGTTAVVTLSAAQADITAAVAGATTIAQTVAFSAMSGLSSATQTCTVGVTATKGGGASDNHKITGWCVFENDNASGVTAA